MKKKILFTVLAFLFVYIGAIAVPYVSHKEVSDSHRQKDKERDCYAQNPGPERTAYLDDNTEALLYRLRMIEEAREHIIFSTFDFNADEAGKDVMAALLAAADRGVTVQVIVDGISGFLDMSGNSYFQALALHENISVKVYNPVNFLKPWSLQARLHDKYLIIDERMYLLGGRNTMNLFLGDYSDEKNIDRELFVYETGSGSDTSLFELKDYFDQVWNLPGSREYLCKKDTEKVQASRQELDTRYTGHLKDAYPESYRTWDWTALTMETNKISLLSNPVEPENKEPWIWYSLHQLMLKGEKITLYTPYIICSKEMYEDLALLKENGIQAEIITNDVASGANPWGCSDYLNQKKNIQATGVKVYEYMGAHSSHTKAILVDDRMSVVGSYNLDMRSTYQDTELMLAVDSKELNAVIRREADRDKTFSKVMGDDGTYAYGEQYVPREIGVGKSMLYALLRVITVPIRRFL